MIKSPLRWPGGKSRAIKHFAEYFPKEINEIREPFVGGGSVGLYLKQKHPDASLWINDLDPLLANFWKQLQADSSVMMTMLYAGLSKPRSEAALRQTFDTCKRDLRGENTASSGSVGPTTQAVQFFYLNRCSYAGLTMSGGFSKTAAIGRFTKTSIERLAGVSKLLQGANITNEDYEWVVNGVPACNTPHVFIFLDPPYDQLKTGKDGLYGNKGEIHAGFDHERFYDVVSPCPHNWMITYNDTPEIRERWKKFNIREWSLTYSLHRTKTDSGETKRKKTELLVTNY